jgi:hypothetical protein
MLPGLMEQAASRKLKKKELMESTQSREQLAQMLEGKGETDLAAGVRGGYLDPEDAFNTYIENKKAANKPVERKTMKDAMGRERFVDTGELLFEADKDYVDPQTQKRQEAAAAAEEKAAQRAAEGQNNAYDIKAAVGQAYGNLGFDPANPTAPSPYNNPWIPDIIEGDRVTGLQGQILRNIGGTRAANLAEDLKTIKSNLGFEELQKMRESSPTGGALGSVSNFDVETLQSTVTSLEQSQTREQLITNLRRIEKIYDAVINGVDDGQGGRRPMGPSDRARIDAEIAAEMKAPAANMQAPGGIDPETEALMEQYAPSGM